MTDVVIDISSGNPLLSADATRIVHPDRHGKDTLLADATSGELGNAGEKIYPSSSQFSQFCMFFNDVEGIIVYIKSMEDPEVSYWDIDNVGLTLTITFSDVRPAGKAVPTITTEYIPSTDWHDGADIYKAWAMTRPWYPHYRLLQIDWCLTGGQNTPYSGGSQNTLLGHAELAAALYPENLICFASNYRDDPPGVGYPDFGLKTGFDYAFGEMRRMGIKVFPYLSGLYWSHDNVDYDVLNMVWHQPVNVTGTGIVNTGGTQYEIEVDATPESININLIETDQLVFTETGNANLDNVAFTINAGGRTDDTHYVATGPDGGGNSLIGKCHYVLRYGSDVTQKLVCMSVHSVRERFATERANLLDDEGIPTEGVYMDTAASTRPFFCFNPHHDHPVGDGSYWVPSVKKVLNQVRQGGLLMAEGFSEIYLTTVNIQLDYSATGSAKDPNLIPLFHYLFPKSVHVGWKSTDVPNDATLNARINDAVDNFGVNANGSPLQSGDSDYQLFLGNRPLTEANLIARGSTAPVDTLPNSTQRRMKLSPKNNILLILMLVIVLLLIMLLLL